MEEDAFRSAWLGYPVFAERQRRSVSSYCLARDSGSMKL